jgi:hypothetical protein
MACLTHASAPPSSPWVPANYLKSSAARPRSWTCRHHLPSRQREDANWTRPAPPQAKLQPQRPRGGPAFDVEDEQVATELVLERQLAPQRFRRSTQNLQSARLVREARYEQASGAEDEVLDGRGKLKGGVSPAGPPVTTRSRADRRVSQTFPTTRGQVRREWPWPAAALSIFSIGIDWNSPGW